MSYLQLGGSSVVGAWGAEGLKTDALSVAAQFRAEVQPLLAAASTGEYTLEDLNVACNILAKSEAAKAMGGASLPNAMQGKEAGLSHTGSHQYPR